LHRVAQNARFYTKTLQTVEMTVNDKAMPSRGRRWKGSWPDGFVIAAVDRSSLVHNLLADL